MAKGRAARAVMTRRAVLVVGGVTLLAGYAQHPGRRITEAAQADAAHPTPVPGRTPSASFDFSSAVWQRRSLRASFDVAGSPASTGALA